MSTSGSSSISQREPRRPQHLKLTSADLPSPEAYGYTLGKTLGSGTYAKVKAAWSPKEKRMIAIKILSKRAASREYLSKFLPRELEIIKNIQHPHIIKVHRLLETDKHCYFILELAENGDLLDYINARRCVPEPEACYLFRQMADAIAYCHSINIVHRDLKCENIMLSKDMTVKVGDFGFALRLDKSPASTPCGSYSYAAPELFTANGDSYDGKKADVWSLGVILYAMVCGRLPFGDDSQVKKLHERRQVTFHKPLSLECRTFIQSLLNTNVSERTESSQMVRGEWPMTMPIKRPVPITEEKYTIANCLPPNISFTRQQNVIQVHMPAATQYTSMVNPPQSQRTSEAQPVSQKSPKPLAAKIGACRRKIADAVKLRGHPNNHHTDETGVPQRATT